MACCDTPSAIARCFSSLKNLSKLAPLWQDAARRNGADAGRCGAGTGRGAGENCAKAGNENASAASAAIAIRGGQERGIVSPARAQVLLLRSYPTRCKKGNLLGKQPGTGRKRQGGIPAIMSAHSSVVNHVTMSW